jgi:hypothetical protein
MPAPRGAPASAPPKPPGGRVGGLQTALLGGGTVCAVERRAWLGTNPGLARQGRAMPGAPLCDETDAPPFSGPPAGQPAARRTAGGAITDNAGRPDEGAGGSNGCRDELNHRASRPNGRVGRLNGRAGGPYAQCGRPERPRNRLQQPCGCPGQPCGSSERPGRRPQRRWASPRRCPDLPKHRAAVPGDGLATGLPSARSKAHVPAGGPCGA